MKPDSVLALAIMGVLLLVLTAHHFALNLMELLVASRSGTTLVLLVAVAGLFYKGFVLSALAMTILSVFLLNDLWKKYPYSDAHRLAGEIARDEARFDPSNSIDLQFGNGTAKHEAPELYVQPHTNTPLLLFPPSEDTLHTMCG